MESLIGDLSELLQAGIDIERACRLLRGNLRYRPVADILRVALTQGDSFASIWSRYDYPIEIQVFIEVGEATGALSEALALAASYLSKRRTARERFSKLLAYPAALLVLNVAVTYLLAAFVIPSFGQMYEALHLEQTNSLRTLFTLARIFTQFGPYAAVSLSLGAGLSYFLRRRIYPHLSGLLKYNAYLRTWVQMTRSYQAMQLFAILLQSGVDIIQALLLLERLDIAHMRRQWVYICQQIEQGATLSEALSQLPQLMPIVFEMMQLSEQTGDIALGTMRLSVYLERMLVRRQEQFVRILEPLCTIFLGGTVGGSTLLLMLPMMDIVSKLA